MHGLYNLLWHKGLQCPLELQITCDTSEEPKEHVPHAGLNTEDVMRHKHPSHSPA